MSVSAVAYITMDHHSVVRSYTQLNDNKQTDLSAQVSPQERRLSGMSALIVWVLVVVFRLLLKSPEKGGGRVTSSTCGILGESCSETKGCQAGIVRHRLFSGQAEKVGKTLLEFVIHNQTLAGS